MKHTVRNFEKELLSRLQENPRLIQIVLGPRQVGKTTGVLSVLNKNYKPSDYEYMSGEEDIFDTSAFLYKIQAAVQKKKRIIVIDEVQKINNWSELVKLAWDQQKQKRNLMHWILLGSSSLQIMLGLNESLTGRFETIYVPHWSFKESKKGFGLNFNDYIHFGGYPASYTFLRDQKRFRHYMTDAIFETVVTKDILKNSIIKKPALFRQTFIQACQYPAQEVSYNKLLGQLQEAGNVDQVKSYLELFSQAFLLKLIFKYTKSNMSRTSSPKILPAAPVFTSLFLRREMTPEETGRVFEAIVGQQLALHFDLVYFWREGNSEVDFVIEVEGKPVAVEVKSKKRATLGLKDFRSKFKGSRACIIDFENYEEFENDPTSFLKEFAI